MKLEFVNRDCGLVATAELIGERWYIEIEATQTLNTLAKDNEADVWEWALQHGFKKRKTAAERTAEAIAKAGQNRPGPHPLETLVCDIAQRAARQRRHVRD